MAEDPQFQYIQNLFTEITQRLDQSTAHIDMLKNTFIEFNASMDRLVTNFDTKIDRLMQAFEIIFHTKEIMAVKEKISQISKRLEGELSEDKVSDLLSQLIETVMSIQSSGSIQK